MWVLFGFSIYIYWNHASRVPLSLKSERQHRSPTLPTFSDKFHRPYTLPVSSAANVSNLMSFVRRVRSTAGTLSSQKWLLVESHSLLTELEGRGTGAVNYLAESDLRLT